MFRRDEEGWRECGPLTWKVEFEDHHGDQSTSIRLKIIWVARWSLDIKWNRPWRAVA